MVTAAIDVHKQVLQAVVLDGGTGVFVEERLGGREALADWAMRWRGRVSAVAIEATTGWRWVARELQACGFDVRLVDPGQAKALQGRKRRAKTDRLDARWLCLLLSKQMLPEAWLPPAEIQELRDRTRLRKALVDTAPAGRSGCTRCSPRRAGPALGNGCSRAPVAAGRARSS